MDTQSGDESVAPDTDGLRRFFWVNFLSGLGLAAMGLFAVTWLIPNGVDGADNMDLGLPPTFMPTVAAYTVIVLGLIVAAIYGRHLVARHADAVEESEENENLEFGVREVVNFLVFSALSVGFMVLLQVSGFLIASGILLAMLIYFMGFRSWPIIIGIAVIVPLAMEQVLWYALSIRLPPMPWLS